MNIGVWGLPISFLYRKFSASRVYSKFVLSNSVCLGLSTPADGSVTVNGYTTGNTAVYSCNDGFELVGNVSRTCMNISEWSGETPTCRSIVGNDNVTK